MATEIKAPNAINEMLSDLHETLEGKAHKGD